MSEWNDFLESIDHDHATIIELTLALEGLISDYEKERKPHEADIAKCQGLWPTKYALAIDQIAHLIILLIIGVYAQ